jgi:gluconolactonase
MKMSWAIVGLVMSFTFTLACGQEPVESPVDSPEPQEAEIQEAEMMDSGRIERLDPALDAILGPDAKLETVAEHLGMTEGPLWIDDPSGGYLLFSDIPANAIYKLSPDTGEVSVFMEEAGYTGDDILNAGAQSMSGRRHVLLIGPNGLTLDPQGRLLIAAMADRNIVRIEEDGSRTVLADGYEGKRFNGVNDLTARSTGAVYFTDMTAGMRYRGDSPSRELSHTGVYMVKDGELTLLEADPAGGSPNGITLSPDESILYVGSAGKILAYDIQEDDTVANHRVLIETSSDGMKVDEEGNLYTTSHGGVWIISPEGKHLGTIHLPEILGVRTTNVGFGDPDRRGLYITARTRLYRIRTEIPGVLPGPR